MSVGKRTLRRTAVTAVAAVVLLAVTGVAQSASAAASSAITRGSSAKLGYFTVRGAKQGVIKGSNAKDTQPLLAYGWSAQTSTDSVTGQSSGKQLRHATLDLTTTLDIAATKLLAALSVNEVLTEVVVTLTKTDLNGQVNPELTITLANASLASVHVYNDSDARLVDLGLSYRTITFTYLSDKSVAVLTK